MVCLDVFSVGCRPLHLAIATTSCKNSIRPAAAAVLSSSTRAPNSLFSLSVVAADDGTEEAVDCTGDSWRYQAANGEWKTELSFPATWESSDTAPMVSFEGFFKATGDGEVTVSGISTSIAPAVSDSLYGRIIELALTCNQEDPVVMEEDSCLLFHVEFTNYSPIFDVNMALFRFEGNSSSAGLDLSVLRIPLAREIRQHSEASQTLMRVLASPKLGPSMLRSQ